MGICFHQFCPLYASCNTKYKGCLSNSRTKRQLHLPVNPLAVLKNVTTKLSVHLPGSRRMDGGAVPIWSIASSCFGLLLNQRMCQTTTSPDRSHVDVDSGTPAIELTSEGVEMSLASPSHGGRLRPDRGGLSSALAVAVQDRIHVFFASF